MKPPRALGEAITASLDRAAGSLADPAAARLELLNAQQLYRAVDPFVRQADPENARAIGRAWLTLTTTMGSSGVFGLGSQEADTDRYLDAGHTINTYIRKITHLRALRSESRWRPRRNVPCRSLRRTLSGRGFHPEPTLPIRTRCRFSF
ncbi:MAG: hypothetical protein GY789_15665 [Hyphomicrobiales bacterium]|nr:hypothetical protein [Hyphomicrobiales bacterium]